MALPAVSKREANRALFFNEGRLVLAAIRILAGEDEPTTVDHVEAWLHRTNLIASYSISREEIERACAALVRTGWIRQEEQVRGELAVLSPIVPEPYIPNPNWETLDQIGEILRAGTPADKALGEIGQILERAWVSIDPSEVTTAGEGSFDSGMELSRLNWQQNKKRGQVGANG